MVATTVAARHITYGEEMLRLLVGCLQKENCSEDEVGALIESDGLNQLMFQIREEGRAAFRLVQTVELPATPAWEASDVTLGRSEDGILISALDSELIKFWAATDPQPIGPTTLQIRVS